MLDSPVKKMVALFEYSSKISFCLKFLKDLCSLGAGEEGGARQVGRFRAHCELLDLGSTIANVHLLVY